MRDINRKCAKCNASRAQDSRLVLHRFPKPGSSNTQRAVAWAKFCYPEDEWNSEEFQRKLFLSHKMLCSKHFPKGALVYEHFRRERLHRFAIPSESCTHTSEDEMPSTVSETGTSEQPETQELMSSGNSNLDQPGISGAIDSSATQIPKTSGEKCSEKSNKEKRLLNRCGQNLQQICRLHNRIKKRKPQEILEALVEYEAVHELSKDLTSSLAVLLQGQLVNCKRKIECSPWPLEQKITALRLYKQSPACYRLLRRMFALPSQATLNNLLKKLPFEPGVNTRFFEVIKKVTIYARPKNKEYSLLFDEMSIGKKNNYCAKSDRIDGFQDHEQQHGQDPHIVSHALVFMIVSIKQKIKQPVAYYLSEDHFTADRLHMLIKQVLHACFNAGITIAATVCDMARRNRRALSLLGVSVEQPYFMFGEHEIVAVYDTCHLLKSFRNVFMKYDIKCNTNFECNEEHISDIAKWSYIEKFHELDSVDKFFVFAPALTKNHLNPNNKQKMMLKFATEVFSHRVCVGMYTRYYQGDLPEALVTTKLITKIDQLLDSLTADNPSSTMGKKYSRNMSVKSHHLKDFKEMKDFFKNCQCIGAKSRPPSLDGWIITIAGVERLWHNLKRKYPRMSTLATRRLQLGGLENYFGCIRSYLGSNCNPTVSQFVSAIKTVIITNSVTTKSAPNCRTDKPITLYCLDLFLTKNAKRTPYS